jgi:hypothetical protein
MDILKTEKYNHITKYENCETEDNIDETCQICFDELEKYDVAILECGHYFHYNCVKEWLINNECPCCRIGENIIQIIENNKKISEKMIIEDEKKNCCPCTIL